MRNATYKYRRASSPTRSVNDRNQTDLLILDFSKAFDEVAHKRLLLKLQCYGIHGLVLAWIKAWLIGRTQQVAFEGEISEKSCVRSGVLQGTGLGPLCFLLFVHDIGNDITSNIKLFADDTLLYGLVHNSDDAISLQSDLDKLVEWAKLWQMAFIPSKCYVLRVCRTKCPFIHPYTMLGHTLQAVDHYPYLGVSLSENLNWKPHILNITNKANSTLGFVKRNLHHCQQKVKDQVYKSLVRPRLEYGCTVWDPYRAYQKSWLEQVQRRAARFVTRTYTREEGCVTNALKLLNWPTLEKRRQVARLTLMYKCVTNQAAIDIPCYVHHQSSLKTRASHPLKFIPLQPSCDTYKYSFWPRTIIDWNSLPSDYFTMDSTVTFKATISEYIF